ncbi:MAG: hypothetical protein LUO89_06200, partial [Methanothrix sp.]|nr:hypothetical protein [Methanothrix sp.]
SFLQLNATIIHTMIQLRIDFVLIVDTIQSSRLAGFSSSTGAILLEIKAPGKRRIKLPNWRARRKILIAVRGRQIHPFSGTSSVEIRTSVCVHRLIPIDAKNPCDFPHLRDS